MPSGNIPPALPGAEVITHSCSQPASGSPPCWKCWKSSAGWWPRDTEGSLPAARVGKKMIFHKHSRYLQKVSTEDASSIARFCSDKKGFIGLRIQSKLRMLRIKLIRRDDASRWKNRPRKLKAEGCWRPHMIDDMTQNSSKTWQKDAEKREKVTELNPFSNNVCSTFVILREFVSFSHLLLQQYFPVTVAKGRIFASFSL